MNLFARRHAFDKLHRDEVSTFTLTNLVYVRDVQVIERRRRLRLADETLHPVVIGSNIRGQDLQRDFAIEFCVLREIHLTHSARADFRHDSGTIRNLPTAL